jgi:hypothetical protein
VNNQFKTQIFYLEIMRKIYYVIVCICLFTSCTSTKNLTTNSSSIWNQKPDLTKVTYEGGDGKSIENPIIIKNAGNEINGVASEYAYISKVYGEKFIDWKVLVQSTGSQKNRKIDIIMIELISKKETISIHFDITEFYGKF